MMRMRNRLLAGFGALGVAGVMVAGHAHADGYLSAAEKYYADRGAATVICEAFDTYGMTARSLVMVLQAVAQDGGFALDDAGDVVRYSVNAYCPRYTQTMNRIIDDAAARTGTRQGVSV